MRSGALAGRLLWPDDAEARFRAMQMCANEAVLSATEYSALAEAVDGLKDCPAL